MIYLQEKIENGTLHIDDIRAYPKQMLVAEIEARSHHKNVALLAQRLRQAADAHHAYETRIGHPDADWPTWYAEYITAIVERRPE
jgi:hypothetical protein